MQAINKNVFIAPSLPLRHGHQGQIRIYKQAKSKRKPQKFITPSCNKLKFLSAAQ